MLFNFINFVFPVELVANVLNLVINNPLCPLEIPLNSILYCSDDPNDDIIHYLADVPATVAGNVVPVSTLSPSRDTTLVVAVASAVGGVGAVLWVTVIILAIIGGVITYRNSKRESKSMRKFRQLVFVCCEQWG